MTGVQTCALPICFPVTIITHETKFFEYNQKTLASTVGNTQILHFGEAYVSGGINDQSRYNRMHNKVGAIYENALLGKFQFFAEDYRFNYFYDKVLILDSGIIPGSLSDEINTVGGQYEYRKNKWNGVFTYSNSISNQSLTNPDRQLRSLIYAKWETKWEG